MRPLLKVKSYMMYIPVCFACKCFNRDVLNRDSCITDCLVHCGCLKFPNASPFPWHPLILACQLVKLEELTLRALRLGVVSACFSFVFRFVYGNVKCISRQSAHSRGCIDSSVVIHKMF